MRDQGKTIEREEGHTLDTGRVSATLYINKDIETYSRHPVQLGYFVRRYQSPTMHET